MDHPTIDGLDVNWAILFVCALLMYYFGTRAALLLSGDTGRIQDILEADYFVMTEGWRMFDQGTLW
jgi:hypothetical protein